MPEQKPDHTSDSPAEQQQHGAADENKLIAERRAKLAAIREKRNPYPNRFRRDAHAETLQRELGDKSKEELEALGHRAAVAGRIMAKRGPFLVLQDMSGRIQAYVDRNQLPAETLQEAKTWDIGDIIGASGVVHKSGKGDLYIYMDSAELLSKSLRPLPDKYHGLQDQELRYRQRYVDLIMNDQARRTFRIRAQLIDGIRDYLTDRGFLEAETPMMQSIPGGAAARPFVTYHNALDLEMYLRISPELYLKRLVIGGFEKVFEINRNFRNEGLSTRHNPEFTMLEFYQAYADYHDLMNLTEDMLRSLAERVLGTTTLTYQGTEYDLARPFARISVFDAILKFNPDIDAAQLADDAGARAIATSLGIALKDSWGLGKVQIEIFEKTVEHRLDQPTFITEYPTEVSPLARRSDDNPFVTDRFEFFVGGREIANGFSELNDPEDQAERFRAQVAEMEAGDDEAMHYDADYITALEYGLPPTAGEGIGIDRLVMLFTDSPSIRDVLLFPHLRPQSGD
ncbi:MAG TPA: lysine--tRNA ligase [Spongiibacteraceae bacterium]|nr:lysine--tRNA ligase [Spongiibacteraceae bacterium]